MVVVFFFLFGFLIDAPGFTVVVEHDVHGDIGRGTKLEVALGSKMTCKFVMGA